MAKGLLAAGFNYSMLDAGEFNDWYDTEHLLERQRTPGLPLGLHRDAAIARGVGNQQVEWPRPHLLDCHRRRRTKHWLEPVVGQPGGKGGGLRAVGQGDDDSVSVGHRSLATSLQTACQRQLLGPSIAILRGAKNPSHRVGKP